MSDHIMFIERFLLSFKELGGNSDGFIDYNVFQAYLNQEGDSMSEILHLINEERCIDNNQLNFFDLCASLLATKVAFNNVSLENGRIGDSNIPINTRTYTRKKSSFQASLKNSSSSDTSESKIFEYQIAGSVFNVADDLLSNRYHMEVLEDSYIEMVVKPLKGLNKHIPFEILILQDKDKVLTSSFSVSSEGFPVCKHHFKKGKYVLVPINLIWSERVCEAVNLASLMDVSDDGQILLTEACEKLLRTVFETIDLDQNGLLSRLEFDLFIQYTSGETAANEWSTIEDNFDIEDNQLTFDGFVELYKMVLQTDPSDVVHMLQLMGIDEELERQNAQPFTLFMKSDVSQFLLNPLPVASYRLVAEKGLCKMAVERGSSKKVKNMNDLFVYILKLPHQVTIVIQNLSHSKVRVQLDCSRSLNYRSHRNKLDCTVQIMPKMSALGHYLVAVDLQKPCSFVCLDELK